MKSNVLLHMPTAAELPVSALLDLGITSRVASQRPFASPSSRSSGASDALWQLALGNMVARTQATPFSVYAALSGDSTAESGGWDAAARVAREGPLTSLQPALQECLECRVALLRQATAARPARLATAARKRSPFCDLRLEEIVLADLATAGLCLAEAARSACSVRRKSKRQRTQLGAPPASPLAMPLAPPKLLQAPTASSTAWSMCARECEAEEGSASEGTCSGSGDSCADDGDLEDDAQSSSPTFSFQAWPAPRRGAPGHAGSMESTAGSLDCGQSPAQA